MTDHYLISNRITKFRMVVNVICAFENNIETCIAIKLLSMVSLPHSNMLRFGDNWPK